MVLLEYLVRNKVIFQWKIKGLVTFKKVNSLNHTMQAYQHYLGLMEYEE